MVWSVLAGVVEGNFGSVVVAKVFHGSELEIAIATATPIAAFITSIIWGMMCVGRPKIRLLVLFSAGAALLTGMAGAIPATRFGATCFICQMAAVQVLMAGVVTVRSAVWKSNYPREVRGRITARLQRVRFVVSVLTALTAAALCDWSPGSYRFIYPGVALVGLAAVRLAARIRIRGERRELSGVVQPADDPDLRRSLVEPFSLTALVSPGHVLGEMVRVLRDDRRYLLYCVAQLFTGLANLMTISIIAAVVTTRLDFGHAWGFWVSTALLVAIPQLAILGSLGRWGGLFDRVGVLGFRVINVMCWTTSILLAMFATMVTENSAMVGAGFLPLAVVLFAGRGIFYGLGRGGGALAWHIGHLHFAHPEKAEIYMGIHVSLTGLRGIVAPIGGVLLWQAVGWPVWVVALAFALVSLAMYRWMAEEEKRRAGAGTCAGGV